MKVLVVEDEFIVRLDVALQFEDEGFDVTAAGTADEALGLLPDAYDVLFTDINMPGKLNGLELAHRVHKLWPDMQVVLTSGRNFASSELPENATFIPKPYAVENVIAAIRPR